MGNKFSDIKQRMRYLALESDPVVRAEYSLFINSNPEAGFARKLLCLVNLYIKKAKNSLHRKNSRPIWLEYSFSQQAKRMPYSEITTLLEKYDVVSFDIFDTLILRPFLSPKDIFAVAGTVCGIMNFKHKRVNAEQTARDDNIRIGKSSEIGFDDIYSRLSHIKEAAALRNAEISAEFDFCSPNPYMKKVYSIAASLGKKIVITTDMYLPATQIQKLLTKCGFSGYDVLLVSCEEKTGKSDGGLFRLIKRKYPESAIIHFGDNPYSDILSAQKNNIQADFYQSCIEVGYKFILPDCYELNKSFYYGLIYTHLFNGDKTFSKWYEYGFCVLGVSVAEYVLQLHEQCLENQTTPEFVGKTNFSIENIYRKFFTNEEKFAGRTKICSDLFSADKYQAEFIFCRESLHSAPNNVQKEEIFHGVMDFATLYIEKALIYPFIRIKQSTMKCPDKCNTVKGDIFSTS